MPLLYRLLLATLLTLPGSLHAQRSCGFDARLQAALEANPRLYYKLAEPLDEPLPVFKTGETVSLPVVVHILYNNETTRLSEAVIREQLAQTNRDLARLNPDASNTPAAFRSVAGSANIELCLVTEAPDGSPSTGITYKEIQAFRMGEDDPYQPSRGGVAAWDVSRYLNIWVAPMDDIFGWATIPELGGGADDGIVVDSYAFGVEGHTLFPTEGGRTLTHELGHYLNLEHTWGLDEGCDTDFVDDTPPQEDPTYDCPSFPQAAGCNGAGANGRMFMNYMDYTDDACMNLFTQGQVARMVAALSHPNRVGLTGANAPSCEAVSNLQVPVSQAYLKLYPNPAQSTVQLQLPSQASELAVYDFTGRSVHAQSLSPSLSSMALTVADWPRGAYQVVVTSAQGLATTGKLLLR